MRSRFSLLAVAAWALLTVALVLRGAQLASHAQGASVEPPVRPADAKASPAAKSADVVGNPETAKFRLREGTRLVNQRGHFELKGETVTFIDAMNREFGAVPNLNLERIARMLKSSDEPEKMSWNVSGAVTEYTTRNYLIISRAVYKAAASPTVGAAPAE